MMAKEWKEMLESLEYSVESLMDDKEMRSGSSIKTSIFASGLLIVDCRLTPRGPGQRSGKQQTWPMLQASQCTIVWRGGWWEAGDSNDNKDNKDNLVETIDGLLLSLKFCEVQFAPKHFAGRFAGCRFHEISVQKATGWLKIGLLCTAKCSTQRISTI